METIPRPDPSEYGAYYRRYVDLVPDGDVLDTLTDQLEELATLVGLKEEEARFRYAPGKWSIKEIIGHLVDSERIFAYRALRIGRGDQTPLAGYEQDDYVKAGGFDERPLGSLLDDHRLVRTGTVALFRSFDADAIERRGTANNNPITVRALAWIIAGHERHHLGVIQEKYLPRPD
jgi:hypothetical protein